MNRLYIPLATVLALSAFTAQAQTGAPLTREQVRSEYFQARDQGRLPGYGEAGNWPQPVATGRALTRTEVLQALRADGPFADGEGADVGAAPKSGSVVSRAEVRAQAIQAVRAGTIVYGER